MATEQLSVCNKIIVTIGGRTLTFQYCFVSLTQKSLNFEKQKVTITWVTIKGLIRNRKNTRHTSSVRYPRTLIALLTVASRLEKCIIFYLLCYIRRYVK